MPSVRTSIVLAALFGLGQASISQADTVVTTFEDVALPPSGYQNNPVPPGQFTIDGNLFNNNYDKAYDTWYGWAISNRTDTTTPGYLNQYSAITGSGVAGSKQYAVGFTSGTPSFSGAPTDPISNPFHPSDTTIQLAAGASALSIAVTNTTYSYLTMKDGDPYNFAHAFGQGDFQRLDIRGYNTAGGLVGTVDFYLADYRSTTKDDWYIVKSWQTIDLSSLAGATLLRFGITSSQNDPTYGVKPPAYFAADNFTFRTAAVPEPASLALLFSGLIGLGAVALRRALVA